MCKVMRLAPPMPLREVIMSDALAPPRPSPTADRPAPPAVAWLVGSLLSLLRRFCWLCACGEPLWPVGDCGPVSATPLWWPLLRRCCNTMLWRLPIVDTDCCVCCGWWC